MEWLAFRSPAHLALFLVAWVPLFGELGRRDQTSLESSVPLRTSWLRAGSLFLLSGLMVTLFLGGWQLLGYDMPTQEHRFSLELLGALCLLGKTFVVTLFAMLTRALSPRLPLSMAWTELTQWALLVTLLAAPLAIVWISHPPSPFFGAVLSALLLGALVITGGYLLSRLLFRLRTSRPIAHSNPYL